MPRLLVLQHVAHEHPGTFTEVARGHNLEVETIRLWEGQTIPDLAAYSRLLIMGGPQSVYDHPEEFPPRDAEIEAIRVFTETSRPVLGVCLGSQLIAYALGGVVYPSRINGKPYKETGLFKVQLTEDGKCSHLFRGFSESFDVFQWHGDVFDLPPDAQLLVSGGDVHNQAFAIGIAYGVLFHLEITPQMVRDLIRIDTEWLHKDNATDEQAIIEAVKAAEQPLRQVGQRLFSNWLSL